MSDQGVKTFVTAAVLGRTLTPSGEVQLRLLTAMAAARTAQLVTQVWAHALHTDVIGQSTQDGQVPWKLLAIEANEVHLERLESDRVHAAGQPDYAIIGTGKLLDEEDAAKDLGPVKCRDYIWCTVHGAVHQERTIAVSRQNQCGPEDWRTLWAERREGDQLGDLLGKA